MSLPVPHFQPSCHSKLQALPDISGSYIPEGPQQDGTEYTYGQLYMYTEGKPAETEAPVIWYQDKTQRECPTDCVIAQKHSSATFVSPRRHSRNENFATRFKNVISIPFLSPLKNVLSLKFRNLKLRKSTSVFVQIMQLKKRH
jgi:hypothetical protein